MLDIRESITIAHEVEALILMVVKKELTENMAVVMNVMMAEVETVAVEAAVVETAVEETVAVEVVETELAAENKKKEFTIYMYLIYTVYTAQ